MTKRELIFYPDKKLRIKCQEVSERNWQEAVRVLDRLIAILEKTGNGVGLSAPQIGEKLRVFIFKNSTDCSNCSCASCHCYRIFINPQIIDTFDQVKSQPLMPIEEKEEKFLEGCLSFPNLYGTVKRWLRIKVRYLDEQGSWQEELLQGIEAIIFQHELDHLDGILFIDHIKEEGGEFFKEEEGKLVSAKIPA